MLAVQERAERELAGLAPAAPRASHGRAAGPSTQHTGCRARNLDDILVGVGTRRWEESDDGFVERSRSPARARARCRVWRGAVSSGSARRAVRGDGVCAGPLTPNDRRCAPRPGGVARAAIVSSVENIASRARRAVLLAEMMTVFIERVADALGAAAPAPRRRPCARCAARTG